MENLLQTIMEKKYELNRLKEEIAIMEEQVFEKVKPSLKSEKLTNTFRYGDCYKLVVKTNPKYKLVGEVPEGIDVYKKSVDETKLKKYANEEWVLAYENRPTITITKEL